MIHCVGHEVVTPSRLIAVAIIEGHVDHLCGTCGNCQQTVVGLDTGGTQSVVWFAVADIVIRERHYQRTFAAPTADPRQDVPTLLQAPEARIALAALENSTA